MHQATRTEFGSRIRPTSISSFGHREQTRKSTNPKISFDQPTFCNRTNSNPTRRRNNPRCAQRERERERKRDFGWIEILANFLSSDRSHCINLSIQMQRNGDDAISQPIRNSIEYVIPEIKFHQPSFETKSSRLEIKATNMRLTNRAPPRSRTEYKYHIAADKSTQPQSTRSDQPTKLTMQTLLGSTDGPPQAFVISPVRSTILWHQITKGEPNFTKYSNTPAKLVTRKHTLRAIMIHSISKRIITMIMMTIMIIYVM